MEISEVKDNLESDLSKENPGDDTYTFDYVGSRLEDQKELDKLLVKWGLKDTFKAPYFRFSHRFHEINPDPFLVDLFNSPVIRQNLPHVVLPGGQYTKVSYTKLRCTQTNIGMFDKIEDNNIVVPETKSIKMMLEEEIKGIMVGDKLRECLLNEESEFYSTFNDEDRREFVFRVFEHLVLGGAMCQYEDKITEYYDQTKQLYKSLVSAKKDPKTNQIFIESHVYQIHKVENEPTFKDTENPQNFLYVIVSPSLRQVTLFVNKWVPYW